MNIFIKILSLIFVILIGACSEKQTFKYELEKDKDIKLITIADIVLENKNSYNQYFMDKDYYNSKEKEEEYIKRILRDINADINESNSSFRMEFSYNVNSKKGEGNTLGYTSSINFDLCSEGRKDWYKYRKDYFPYRSLYNGDTTFGSLFISIKTLEKRGLLSNNSSSQEDICIYIESSRGGGVYTTYRDTSNMLIFTAQEINKVMEEYNQITEEGVQK